MDQVSLYVHNLFVRTVHRQGETHRRDGVSSPGTPTRKGGQVDPTACPDFHWSALVKTEESGGVPRGGGGI